MKLASKIDEDSILVDGRLSQRQGMQVCRELRRRGVNSPVLMFTACTPVNRHVNWPEAGVDAYPMKPFAVGELLACVRALVRRRYGKNEFLLVCADLELDQHRRRAQRAGVRIRLTPTEFALLELLLLRSPAIVSLREIVEHVWDTRFEVKSNLVAVYISRLRHKIDHGHSVKLNTAVPRPRICSGDRCWKSRCHASRTTFSRTVQLWRVVESSERGQEARATMERPRLTGLARG